MATFSIASSGSQYGSSPTVSFSDITLGNGNFLVAVVSSREPNVSHTSHTLNDGRFMWTKIYGFDNELSSTTGAAHSQSVWWRPVKTGENASLSVDSAVVESGSAYQHRLSAFQIAPSTVFPAGVVTSTAAGSGTSDWNDLNSGNTSNANALITIDELDPVYGNLDRIPGSLDSTRFSDGLLVLCIGSCSNSSNSGELPTTANFDGSKDVVSRAVGSADEVATVLAFQSDGQTSGVKTATIDTNGANNPGVAGVVVFRNAADTGDVLLSPVEISGIAQRGSTGTGALTTPAAEVSGLGGIGGQAVGIGNTQTPVTQVSGVAQRHSVGTGDVIIPAVEVDGEAIRAIGGVGNIIISPVTVNGFGEPILTRPPRGAGKSKQRREPSRERPMGPQQLRERKRIEREKELERERLEAQAVAQRMRDVDNAVAMLLLL